jgi:predicted ribosome quality control (RQC) complex YloA/Tae2 family protein
MQIEIILNKSVDENAGLYFNKAKKAKKKLEGAKETVLKYQKELDSLKQKESNFQEQEFKKQAKKAKKEANKRWYFKFHHFQSSEGFICVGGRDATQNEILIKKHTENNDLVLHTDMAGSPFFIIKEGQNKECTDQTIQEAAQAVACYSRAWKEGHGTADVLYVKPDQVSKVANPGEVLAKGSFMIRGKTNYFHPNLEFAAGMVNTDNESQILLAPAITIKQICQDFLIILPGRDKKSVIAKKIKKELKVAADLDEIVAKLPAGGCELKRRRKNK